MHPVLNILTKEVCQRRSPIGATDRKPANQRYAHLRGQQHFRTDTDPFRLSKIDQDGV